MSVLHTLLLATTISLAEPNVLPSSSMQSDDDWDLSFDPARELTAASISFSNGVTIVAQCEAGMLITAVTGVPVLDVSNKDYRLALGGTPIDDWFLTPRSDGALLDAGASPRIIRAMKLAESVTVRVSSDETALVRIEGPLPTQSNGLDAVLTACGRPTTDDRDRYPSADGLLISTPGLIVPERAFRMRGASTFQVSLMCIIAGSRLSGCWSDYEVPADPATGTVVAEGANGSRVELTDEAAAQGRVVNIVVTGTRFRR